MERSDLTDPRYEVLAVAGRGGMGVVHRVRHRLWNVELAVKTPLPHVVENPEARRRYVQEAETWIDLGLHPNIVQCWFVQEIGGLPRLFLDYVSGGSLKDWMTEGKVEPGQLERILDLAIQACDGLAWAQARGMVHRDIKPGNLLVAPDGALFVTDFGMVKRAESTEHGGAGGTPAYGAPEQWLNQDVDGRADVYAMGVTLYELASGSRPFDDPEHPEPPSVILGRHFTLPAPDVRSVRPDVPAPLADLIARCLAKAPAARPAGAAALRAELAAIHRDVLGRPARAEPQLEGLRADGLNNRAVSLAELGRTEAALAAWQEALAADRHHPEALFNKTLVEWRAGRVRLSEVLRRLDEARPAHRGIGLYAGLVRLEAMDPAGAGRELAGVLDLPEFGPDVTARRALGHAFMCQERFADAEAAYADVLRRQPGDPASETGLALARAQTRAADGRLLFPAGRRIATVVAGNRPPGIRAVAYAGELAVTGGEDAAVHVWDLAGRRCLTLGAGHDGPVNAVAVSGDRALAVSGAEDGVVKAWALPEGRVLNVLAGHEDAVVALALAPDRKLVVSASRDRTARVWDLESGACRHVLRGHPDAIRSVELSPDGRLAMVACAGEGALILWDLATGALHRQFDGLGAGAARLVGLPGGQAALLRWDGEGLALHAFPQGGLLRRFEGHAAALADMVATADGRIAVTLAGDDTVRAWDVATGACVALLRGHDGARALALSADARTVAIGAPRDCAIVLWELEADLTLIRASLAPNRARSYGETLRLAKRFRDFLDRARAARDGGKPGEAVVMLASARSIAGYERHPAAMELNAALARTQGAGVRNAWTDRAVPAPAALVQLVATPDGDAAVTADAAGDIAAYDLRAEQCLRRVRAHAGPLAALALSPDGLRVATATTAAEPLRIFDLVHGTCARELAGHDRPARSLAFAHPWLVSATDAELKVWDPGTGRCVQILEGLPGRVLAVAPSGRFAVCAAPAGPVLAVGLAGGLVARLTGHFKTADAAALAADERVLATGGRDATVRVWELASGACRAVSEVLPAPVRALAVAPDGRTVAAACEDGTLAFLALATAKVQRTLATAGKPVALAFLEGGQLLAVATEEGRIQLVGLDWQLDTGEAAAPLSTALALAPPATSPPPAFEAAAEPARQRLPEWLALGGAPALPVRARIAATALWLVALLGLVAAGLPASGPGTRAMAMSAASIVLSAGWRAGQEWARMGAMAAFLALAAACGWSAVAQTVDVALAVPAVAVAAAALVHALLGHWDAIQAIPGAVIAFVAVYYLLPPGAVMQCGLVAVALGALALLEGVRSPDTERWFAAKKLEKK